MSTENKGIYSKNIIVLRSVYGKVGQHYFINPVKNKNGQLPACVKRVNSVGDMIITDDEKNSGEFEYFIPETYFVYWGLTPDKFVDKMVAQHDKVWNADRLAKNHSPVLTFRESRFLALLQIQIVL